MLKISNLIRRWALTKKTRRMRGVGLDKRLLLVIPFSVGLSLMFYSWFLTYPIAISSINSYSYNSISVLYWISLCFLLPSMFLMAATSKSDPFRWLVSVGMVIALYSLFYFYSSMPTSDSQFFRGLVEYFSQTKSLNILTNHIYYQWPSFFLIFQIGTDVSGLSVTNLEFLLFTLIGILFTTGLYVYASKIFKQGAFLAVIAFFTSNMVLFLNYQSVPFSLALALLFLVFMLETKKPTVSVQLTIGLLYVGMLFTHAFVPLFFVIYCLIRTIIERSRHYFILFQQTLFAYFIIQFYFAQFAFSSNIASVLTRSPEYSNIVAATTSQAVTVPSDFLFQNFSRIAIIGFISICIIGFVLVFAYRKLRSIDKAILLMGISYSAIGLVLYTLGSRAISLAFVPVSLGAAFLFEYKFRPSFRYFKYVYSALIIILLLLVPFIIIHQSFNNDIQFQTQEAYLADNFLLNHYNWNGNSYVTTDYRTVTYLQSRLSVNPNFAWDSSRLNESGAILYDVGLGKTLGTNYEIQNFSKQGLDTLYNDGFSQIEIKNFG